MKRKIAANKIGKWYRLVKQAKNPNDPKERLKLFKRKTASSLIAFWWRRHRSRQLTQPFLAHYHRNINSIIKLQAFLRGALTRLRFENGKMLNKIKVKNQMQLLKKFKHGVLSRYNRKITHLRSEYLQIKAADKVQNEYFDQYINDNISKFEDGWIKHARDLKKYIMT